MKSIFKLLVLLEVMEIFSYGSCDKWVCSENWFVNETAHKVNVNVYCHGEMNNELSFFVAPKESINREACACCGIVDPFTQTHAVLTQFLLFLMILFP